MTSIPYNGDVVGRIGSSPGGVGTLILRGKDSELRTSNHIAIGFNEGSGTLLILEGAKFYGLGGDVALGLGPTTGWVNIDGKGSTWQSDSRLLGAGGNATVLVSNGGLLRQVGSDWTDVVDGPDDQAQLAQVIISGAGSRYVLDGELLMESGHTLLVVENGGFVSAGTIDLAGGGVGTLSIAGAGARVEVTDTLWVAESPTQNSGGSASINISGGAALQVAGDTRVGPHGRVEVSAGDLAAGSLTIRTGQVVLDSGANKVLRTNLIVVTAGGKIDLSDNAAIVDYSGATPIAAIKSLIASGYAGGTWTGTGISSSTADASARGLGYAESAQLSVIPPIFGTVDTDTLLIRFTRYGDATLDGLVNVIDFSKVASNFGFTGKFWFDGDFNYDGNVNVTDFGLLAGNFGLVATGPNGTVTPQDWANLAAAVPEPFMTSFTVVATGAMLSRRRPSRRSQDAMRI